MTSLKNINPIDIYFQRVILYIIPLFKDIKRSPNKYNQSQVLQLIGQIAGKVPVERNIKIPF